MKIVLLNKKTKVILGTADVIFGLDTLIVKECDMFTPKELNHLLMKKAEIQNYIYEMDDVILKKLDLYHKKALFGRMTEAKVLYAMLNHFETKDDDILIYPQKNELICMIPLNPAYSNIYLWETYHNE